MMLQARAMFLDAYRELNNKKLFWIVLILSGLLVGVFGVVGINERGLTVLHWEIPSFINSTLIPEDIFYKLTFANLGIKWWLAWFASILALVSTAGMFPDFIASGSIELTLSKPVGRLRLFVLKYLSGLLFVALQVGIFSLASFLVIGLRAKTWTPGIFLAIPITVGIFSFLYCVCVLLAMITRSTIASLLLTLLFWVSIFGIHATEQGLLYFKERNAVQQETLRRSSDAINKRGQKNLAANPQPTGIDPISGLTDSDKGRLERNAKRLEQTEKNARRIWYFHTGFYAAKTFLPKTGESAELMQRALLSAHDRERLKPYTPEDRRAEMSFGSDDDVRVDEGEVGERMQQKVLSRSVWWVFGTSMLFELFVLGIAATIFCRRDF